MVGRLLSGHSEKMLMAFCTYRVAIDSIYILGREFFIGLSIPEPDVSIERYMLSWLLFLFLAYLYNCFIFCEDKLKYSLSQQVILFLFLLSVIPFFSMYGAGVISDECFLYYNIYFYVFLVTEMGINYSLCDVSTDTVTQFYSGKKQKWQRNFFFIMCIIAISAILITFFYYVGGKIYVDGIAVYGQRALFSSIQNNMPRLLVYFISFVIIIEIVMLIYCLRFKKYTCVVLLLFLGYIHFSLAAEKSVLLGVVFAVVLYFLASKLTLVKIVMLNSSLAFICLLLSFCAKYCNEMYYSVRALDEMLPWLYMPLIFLRRVIFIPAHLHDIYCSFFEYRTPSYWGINTEYSIGQGLENYISDIYLDSSLGFANNGLLGDSIANIGVYGVFLYPVLIAFILYAFDYVLKGKGDARIFMGLALMFTIFLMNSQLTTIMISHGGFVMLLMLWCFPDDSNVKRNADID